MRFGVIYADPPWPYNARNNPNTRFGRGAYGHYPLMKFEEIYNLPVRDVAADNCVLFLWVVAPKIEKCLATFSAWGFDCKTKGFNWVKTNPGDGRPFYGIGYYTASNSEDCYIGTRGEFIKPAAKPSQVIILPRGEHSAKPVEVYSLIEAMYPEESKLELFARENRVGWWSCGNGVEKIDIRTSLEILASIP